MSLCAALPCSARAARPPPAPGTARCSSAASSTARRLSSRAACRPAASAAGNMPPRQYPESSRPWLRTSRDTWAEPGGRDLVAPGRDRADAAAGAGLDDLRQRQSDAAALAHRGGVDGQPAVVLRKIAHGSLTGICESRYRDQELADDCAREEGQNPRRTARRRGVSSRPGIPSKEREGEPIRTGQKVTPEAEVDTSRCRRSERRVKVPTVQRTRRLSAA